MKRLLLAFAFALSSACIVSLPPTKPTQPPTVTPPAATSVSFDVVTCQTQTAPNHCAVPVPNASVAVQVNATDYVTQTTNADGYTLFTVPSSVQFTRLVIKAAGFTDKAVESFQPAACNNGCHNIIILSSAWPQPIASSPLVLEPNDPGTGDVCPANQVVTIPDLPSKRFWRGDAWGTTLPGAPVVPGGSSRHPERILTWFYDRYPADWQHQILLAYRDRGYTHFTLSWPDSRDGNGQSASQFAATAKVINQAIPFIHVMLTSKDFDPANADAPTRMAEVSPAIDALMAAGFTGDNLILGVGWELDTFNEGQNLENFINALHAKYPQFDLYAHFTTYKTSWQPDGQPRAQFWQATAGALTGLLYQANQNDPCGLMAAHFNDAQIPPSGLQAVGAILVPWELVASNEFDGDHPNENDANARSWSIMNTPGQILASGFGNGSRYPNGQPTLRSY